MSFVELFVPFLWFEAPVLWCLSSWAVRLGAVQVLKVCTRIEFVEVGYGDLYPESAMGRIVASITAFLGLGVWAVEMT